MNLRGKPAARLHFLGHSLGHRLHSVHCVDFSGFVRGGARNSRGFLRVSVAASGRLHNAGMSRATCSDLPPRPKRASDLRASAAARDGAGPGAPASPTGAGGAGARPLARTDPKRQREKRPYKIRGPETWALIRESYLAGASARQLARRYDVTEWAIWRRAWKEGWTKTDRVEPRAPAALSPTPLPGPEAGGDPEALKKRALLGVEHAMAAGRLDEAAELARLAASLSRMAAAAGTGAGGAPDVGPQEETYKLEDVARALLDPDFAAELMWVNPGDPPHPVKDAFWRIRAKRSDHIEGMASAFRMWMEDTRGQPAGPVREPRDAAEAERWELARQWLQAKWEEEAGPDGAAEEAPDAGRG